jgi:hypothetical protein
VRFLLEKTRACEFVQRAIFSNRCGERIVDVVWYGSGMIHWNGLRQPFYGKYGEFMVDNTL